MIGDILFGIEIGLAISGLAFCLAMIIKLIIEGLNENE